MVRCCRQLPRIRRSDSAPWIGFNTTLGPGLRNCSVGCCRQLPTIRRSGSALWTGYDITLGRRRRNCSVACCRQLPTIRKSGSALWTGYDITLGRRRRNCSVACCRQLPTIRRSGSALWTGYDITLGPEAAQLLGRLLSATPDDPEVRHRALDWLRHYPEADAARLLGPLLSAAPGDPELQQLALSWLDSNSQHPEAYGVLTSLLSRAPDDPSIRDRAMEWHDTRRTCFLVGRAGTELRVLELALRKRNVTTITPEHLQAGGQLLAPLLAQMKNADFVSIILQGASAPPNVIFEAGVAAGLGKPVLVFSIGRHGFPFDLNSTSVVRLDGPDVSVIEMHLDAFLSTLPQQKRTRQVKRSKQTNRKENSPEFAGAHEQLEALKATRDSLQHQPQQSNRAKDLAQLGFQLENLVTDLFRLGGYTATSSPGPDYGVDLAVSSPKVQRELGGPLLVQVKSRLAPSMARDAARGISKLVEEGRGSAGLVITLAEKASLEEVLLQQPLILAMSAQRLIRLVERDNLVRTIVAARDQQLNPDL